MSDGHDIYIKPGDVKTETVSSSDDKQVEVKKSGVSKKKIFQHVASGIFSVLVWNQIIVPGIHLFLPEYSKVNEEISPVISDLLEASSKNCGLGNYNRRGCKSVWAGVHIPELTADGH